MTQELANVITETKRNVLKLSGEEQCEFLMHLKRILHENQAREIAAANERKVYAERNFARLERISA